MSGIQVPFMSGEACDPRPGSAHWYYADVYIPQFGHNARVQQVPLGRRIDMSNMSELIERTLMATKAANDPARVGDIKEGDHRTPKIIGVDYLLLCARRQHAAPQAERVGAFAFVELLKPTIAIDPHSLRTIRGIGHAVANFQQGRLLAPVIDFPMPIPDIDPNDPALTNQVLIAESSIKGNEQYVAFRPFVQLYSKDLL